MQKDKSLTGTSKICESWENFAAISFIKRVKGAQSNLVLCGKVTDLINQEPTLTNHVFFQSLVKFHMAQ